MAGESEPAKLLLPYLQRADELQKHEPLVAYYCRLYAMEKGLKIPQSERTKTTNSLLVSLMNQLEKDKKSLQLGPEDNLHIEGFALNVFGKADKQDRAGRADLNTAKTFYAASVFFEILNQFGPLQPDLEQKQKYAVWKAADIRKALKEGRKPNPGPPADDDLLVPSSTPHGGYDLGASDSAATIPRSESNLSPQFHEHVNDMHATSIPPSPQFQEGINYQHSAHVLQQTQFDDSANYQHSAHMPPQTQFDDSTNYLHSARMPPQTQFDDLANSQHSLNNMPSPPFPNAGYPSHDFRPPPPPGGSDNSTYTPQYHHKIYPQDSQQQSPHSYPSQETSPYSYPNFQSYPSFSDSSLPSVPSHYPSYYQGSDSSYIPQSAAPTTNYSSTVQRTSSGRNGPISDTLTTSSQTYQYDSSYQPPPEKIAEAHKAARFAVGALAFDDVSVAVDYLKKSLEMLTRPSASQ